MIHLLAALLACGTAGSLHDADGDSYAFDGGDCDDSDPGTHPGATEVPDALDNDCNGLVDDHTVAYDDDGDGYNEESGDCDDADAGAYPGAVEVPDGVDQDCDGFVDDGTSVYDDDADGYDEEHGDCDDGDPTQHPAGDEVPNGADDDCDGTADDGTVLFDDDGDGYAEVEGDCDDDDPDVHPDAGELADGVDQDCDGDVDEGTDTVDDDWDGYSEAEGDCEDGDSTIHPGADEICGNSTDDDCDGVRDDRDGDLDGHVDLACGGDDCDDADPATYPGGGETFDGQDNDCDGTADEDTEVSDDDGDGLTELGGDCDDADPSVFPGAGEQLDERDNDCDGMVDNGAHMVVSIATSDADYAAAQASASRSSDVVSECNVDPAHLPTSLDWTNLDGVNYLPSPKNQGRCGSCTTFAGVGVLEAGFLLQGVYDDAPSLSEAYLLACSTQMTTCGAGIDKVYSTTEHSAVSDVGLVGEDVAPYDAMEAACGAEWTASGHNDTCVPDEEHADPSATCGMSPWAADSDYRVSRAVATEGTRTATEASVRQQVKELLQLGPVMTDLYAGPSPGGCSTPASLLAAGYVEVYTDVTTCGVNHAIDIVGYVDDATMSAGGYWIIRNSWGASWEDGGYAKVAYGAENILWDGAYLFGVGDGSGICNGYTDFVLPSQCDPVTNWFPDDDGDGYGDDVGVPVARCSQPTGYVNNSDDCDDGDPGIHPGAGDAADGFDNNCNDFVDEEVIEVTFTPTDLVQQCDSSWHVRGDCDFDAAGEDGVTVALSATASASSSDVSVTVSVDMREVPSDYTELRYTQTYSGLYTPPSGCVIDGIVGEDTSTWSATGVDRDAFDIVSYFPGSGPVYYFQVQADTGGDDVCNCTSDDAWFSLYFAPITVELACPY